MISRRGIIPSAFNNASPNTEWHRTRTTRRGYDDNTAANVEQDELGDVYYDNDHGDDGDSDGDDDERHGVAVAQRWKRHRRDLTVTADDERRRRRQLYHHHHHNRQQQHQMNQYYDEQLSSSALQSHTYDFCDISLRHQPIPPIESVTALQQLISNPDSADAKRTGVTDVLVRFPTVTSELYYEPLVFISTALKRGHSLPSWLVSHAYRKREDVANLQQQGVAAAAGSSGGGGGNAVGRAASTEAAAGGGGGGGSGAGGLVGWEEEPVVSVDWEGRAATIESLGGRVVTGLKGDISPYEGSLLRLLRAGERLKEIEKRRMTRIRGKREKVEKNGGVDAEAGGRRDLLNDEDDDDSEWERIVNELLDEQQPVDEKGMGPRGDLPVILLPSTMTRSASQHQSSAVSNTGIFSSSSSSSPSLSPAIASTGGSAHAFGKQWMSSAVTAKKEKHAQIKALESHERARGLAAPVQVLEVSHSNILESIRKSGLLFSKGCGRDNQIPEPSHDDFPLWPCLLESLAGTRGTWKLSDEQLFHSLWADCEDEDQVHASVADVVHDDDDDDDGGDDGGGEWEDDVEADAAETVDVVDLTTNAEEGNVDKTVIVATPTHTVASTTPSATADAAGAADATDTADADNKVFDNEKTKAIAVGTKPMNDEESKHSYEGLNRHVQEEMPTLSPPNASLTPSPPPPSSLLTSSLSSSSSPSLPALAAPYSTLLLSTTIPEELKEYLQLPSNRIASTSHDVRRHVLPHVASWCDQSALPHSNVHPRSQSQAPSSSPGDTRCDDFTESHEDAVAPSSSSTSLTSPYGDLSTWLPSSYYILPEATAVDLALVRALQARSILDDSRVIGNRAESGLGTGGTSMSTSWSTQKATSMRGRRGRGRGRGGRGGQRRGLQSDRSQAQNAFNDTVNTPDASIVQASLSSASMISSPFSSTPSRASSSSSSSSSPSSSSSSSSPSATKLTASSPSPTLPSLIPSYISSGGRKRNTKTGVMALSTVAREDDSPAGIEMASSLLSSSSSPDSTKDLQQSSRMWRQMKMAKGKVARHRGRYGENDEEEEEEEEEKEQEKEEDEEEEEGEEREEGQEGEEESVGDNVVDNHADDEDDGDAVEGSDSTGDDSDADGKDQDDEETHSTGYKDPVANDDEVGENKIDTEAESNKLLTSSSSSSSPSSSMRSQQRSDLLGLAAADETNTGEESNAQLRLFKLQLQLQKGRRGAGTSSLHHHHHQQQQQRQRRRSNVADVRSRHRTRFSTRPRARPDDVARTQMRMQKMYGPIAKDVTVLVRTPKGGFVRTFIPWEVSWLPRCCCC